MLPNQTLYLTGIGVCIIVVLYFKRKLSPSILSFVNTPLKLSQKKPIILTWTRFFRDDLAVVTRDSECLHECFITEDRSYLRVADAVVFHLFNMRRSDLPLFRLPRQYYIFLTFESPEHRIRTLVKKYKRTKNDQDYQIPDNFFNLTVTYRADSDIYAPYGHFLRIEDNRQRSIGVQYDVKSIFERPNLVLQLVSNCRTPSRRENYVDQLKQYINITQLGKCFGRECSPECETSAISMLLMQNCCNDRKRKFCLFHHPRFEAMSGDFIKVPHSKHKFYLSFENSVCQDYITEKIFDRLGYMLPVLRVDKALEIRANKSRMSSV
ncbi:unnamed protein product [Enterobius vermicularis]|uniref:Fucosyltransferase n=1 Tax=Enterobius vermicularis TaxID=51028 RepID=A0A0N4VMV3_ENTVE|nr:unnamed protein product [Enterobius vermicularis]